MKNKSSNKRIVRIVLIFIPIVLFNTKAISSYPPRFQVGANFLLEFPQGEFKDVVNHAGFGVSGEFLYALPMIPVSVGLSGSYIIYGNDTRRVRLIPGVAVDVDVETSNNIAMGHFLLRAQQRQGAIRPYMDGLIGFNYLFTQTLIKNRSEGVEIASSINVDDFAFSYGGGAGIMISVYQRPIEEIQDNAGLARVNLDLRLRYLFGSEAKYLFEDSIEIAGEDVFYNETKSLTDIITLQIGAILEF